MTPCLNLVSLPAVKVPGPHKDRKSSLTEGSARRTHLLVTLRSKNNNNMMTRATMIKRTTTNKKKVTALEMASEAAS